MSSDVIAKKYQLDKRNKHEMKSITRPARHLLAFENYSNYCESSESIINQPFQHVIEAL